MSLHIRNHCSADLGAVVGRGEKTFHGHTQRHLLKLIFAWLRKDVGNSIDNIAQVKYHKHEMS